MTNEWIQSHKDYFIDEMTATLSGPEKFTTTSRKIMDTSSLTNISKTFALTLNKSMKNVPTTSSSIDSGS
jgi:hypothetical protein